MNNNYIRVWIPGREIEYFVYRNSTTIYPEEGIRVLVPLKNEQLIGYVIGIESSPTLPDNKIKNIIEIIDEQPLLPNNLLRLIKWASGYYLRPWGEFMHTAIPAGLHLSTKLKITISQKGTLKALSINKLPAPQQKILELIASKKSVSYETLKKLLPNYSLLKILKELSQQNLLNLKQEIKEYASTSNLKKAIELIRKYNENDKLTIKQKGIIDFIANKNRNILGEELYEEMKVSASVLKSLEKKGLIRIYEEMIQRELLWPDMLSSSEKIILTKDQQNADETLERLLNKDSFAVALLHGVTGSGKTELYIRLIERVVIKNKTALLLMPEIALVPAVMNRFKNVFGTNMGILHSRLTPAQRAEQWLKIKEGEVKIVIGVRSAIFAPLQNIGVIIVDEEHDDSYKQTENPRYNARDLAIIRAKLENCLAALGSATPSLESYHWAQKKIYEYIRLPKRIYEVPLPDIKIIDMRIEYKETSNMYFSRELLAELEQCLQRKQQAMILINRRGYANYLLCRECGEILQCNRCSISLHYHKQYNAIICHYCGLKVTVPDKCPNCKSDFISLIGSGTEKIESLLKEKFPSTSISRLDSDTAHSQKNLFQILSDFSYQKIDILVGTSIIGKGHHYPNVTLAGIISADNALNLPDFRAAEKTFQLITQLAGRSGRGEYPGKVIIQSFYPEHYAIETAKKHNYNAFYEQEISFRQHLLYPPFLSLANIVLAHCNKSKIEEASKTLANLLSSKNEKSFLILGPSPCPIVKISNMFRYHLLLKLLKRNEAKPIIYNALNLFSQHYPYIRLYCDIDPISIL